MNKLQRHKSYNFAKYLRKNLHFYPQLFNKLKINFTESDHQKIAFSFSVGICIGIAPIVGVTFIVATITGALLKLNQITLQIAHLIVTPIQIILLPVFLKFGQFISEQNIHLAPDKIAPINITTQLCHWGSIFIYSLIIWMLLAIIIGIFTYKLIITILKRKSKSTNSPAYELYRSN